MFHYSCGNFFSSNHDSLLTQQSSLIVVCRIAYTSTCIAFSLLQITSAAVDVMDEQSLSKFLPSEGERIIARNFGRVIGKPTTSLLDRLRQKFVPKSNTDAPKKKAQSVPRNGIRRTRKVEIGWMDYDDGKGTYKQVRTQSGGGTREVHMDKSATMKEVLEKAKYLFFQNDVSPRGKLDDFHCSLLDFKLEDTDHADGDEINIGTLYEKTQAKILRFYLCTRRNHQNEGSNAECPSQTHPKRKQTVRRCKGQRRLKIEETVPKAANVAIESRDDSDDSQKSLPDLSGRYPHLFTPESPKANSADCTELINGNAVRNVDRDDSGVVSFGPFPGESQTLDLTVANDGQDGGSNNILERAMSLSDLTVDGFVNTLTSTPTGNADISTGATGELVLPLPILENINALGMSDLLEHRLTDAQAQIPNLEQRIIEIRRTECLSDMIKEFASDDILQEDISVCFVQENGKREIGKGQGVMADCLTQFWNDFYEKCTLGTQEKVPCLRHDFKEKEWEAVARILLFGWKHFTFLPSAISRVFLFNSLGVPPNSDALVSAFINYVGDDEREILQKAVADFAGAEMEDLLEVLGTYGCKHVPNGDNFHSLLADIAHKELLQQPMFIMDSWKSILTSGNSSPLIELERAAAVYAECSPTPRKVLKRLVFPQEMSDLHRTTANHLKRYIRECDSNTMKAFLRFCTGFNILLKQNETITIEFHDMSEFTRRPVGRTCGQVLELASEYPSYPDFRTEFNLVLSSGIMNFDIV